MGRSAGERASMLRGGDGRSTIILLALMAIVSLGEQIRQLATFGRRNVTEDQALLWVVARDLGHGSIPQPGFYGQDYGTAFEAAPVELVRRLGVELATAVPLVLSASGLLGWWLIGAASYRRGHRVLACLAIGAPVVMATEYSLMVSTYPTALGRLLAAACVAAVVMVDDERAPWMAMASLCGGLAVAWDASTALVVFPAVAYAVLHGGTRRRLRWTMIGATVPAAWLILIAAFFRRHRDYALHPGPSFSPSWSILRSNLATPGRHFGVLAPELVRVPVVPLLFLAGLVIVLLIGADHRRDWLAIGCAVGVSAATLLILSVPRSIDGWPTSIYLRPARVLLVFPIGLWLVAYVASTAGVFDGRVGRRWSQVRRWSAPLAVGLVLVSAAVRTVRFDGERSRTLSVSEATWQYQPWRSTAVTDVCASIDTTARASSVDAPVVFLQERLFAYACAALWGRTDATLFPEYERRTWLLHDADHSQPDAVMIFGADEASCRQWSAKVESCLVVDGELDMVVIRPGARRTLMAILRELGVAVRPYDIATDDDGA